MHRIRSPTLSSICSSSKRRNLCLLQIFRILNRSSEEYKVFLANFFSTNGCPFSVSRLIFNRERISVAILSPSFVYPPLILGWRSVNLVFAAFHAEGVAVVNQRMMRDWTSCCALMASSRNASYNFPTSAVFFRSCRVALSPR